MTIVINTYFKILPIRNITKILKKTIALFLILLSLISTNKTHAQYTLTIEKYDDATIPYATTDWTNLDLKSDYYTLENSIIESCLL